MEYIVNIRRKDGCFVNLYEVESKIRRRLRRLDHDIEGGFIYNGTGVDFVTESEESAMHVYSKVKRTFDLSIYEVSFKH